MRILLALGEDFDGMKIGVVLFHRNGDGACLHILLDSLAAVLKFTFFKTTKSQVLFHGQANSVFATHQTTNHQHG